MSCATILKNKGHKLTVQRRVILDILHGSDGHVTAEEILKQVQARAPGVNKSTIYRTLDLLEELGIVVRSELGERFIFHHAEQGHHHHLICHKCGRVLDAEEDIFEPLKELLVREYNFVPDMRHLVILGHCLAPE